ncbi:hypothetical protein QVL70_04880 [Bartonella henselae]|nr:hypothetical protein [Bartonella henselae]ATP12398.1 hypothetical protein BhenCHDE101_04370 [Bartonella henselae]MDM9983615.1 hypothetical protein [Bartonella henselae]MDM9985199.1 hypothetical protein [Bartonella henselae]MDM9986460.1 hypothetical protein [Bartonella henselae]MDM9988175.1 hypothetical protein [Bartonella henselae]
MKLIRKVMPMCVLIFLSGCASRSFSCIGWSQLYLDQKDLTVISINLAKQILKHNKYGEQLCGWKQVQKVKTQK